MASSRVILRFWVARRFSAGHGFHFRRCWITSKADKLSTNSLTIFLPYPGKWQSTLSNMPRSWWLADCNESAARRVRSSKLKSILTGYECRTVPEEGLAGKRNGELLSLAEDAGFDVFLTVDRGIEFQQNLQSRRIAVLL